MNATEARVEISNATLEMLLPHETAKLEKLEQVVFTELEGAIRFADALATIRDERLYRAQFETFEVYCRVKWQMQARSVRRLIDQAKVLGVVSEPDEIGSAWTVPASPSVVRPLIGLPPEHQRQAWREAVATATGKITTRHVERVVGEYKTRLGIPVAETKGTEPDIKARAEDPAVDRATHAKADDLIRQIRELADEVGRDSVAATGLYSALHNVEWFKGVVREAPKARVQ
jgi:hypothetical protein